jgi:hypothetical protein
MSEKTLSIGFSEKEYSEVLKLAQKEGFSISQYIKSKIIPNEFNEKYKILIQEVLGLEPNTEFTIKDMLKPHGWENISKGVKLSLGKHFYAYVNSENNNIIKVKVKGFGVSGIMCYIKE